MASNNCLQPGKLAEFRRNTEELNNRAVFEIPEILAKLLGRSARRELVAGAFGTRGVRKVRLCIRGFHR